ncbi:MAG: type II toxin-antitoxin system Phd/YefM family antitoxin [Alphaproteobacteria bacterium]|nr:type II toxin-antitoxin system Phd/YefM family antitoxin [Alphaproteobacteria bacterium]
MKPVTIHAAKTNLSKLIARACNGEEVVIARRDKPVVKLVPVETTIPKRKFGALKGKVDIDERFFEPLPDDILRAFGAKS